MTMTRAAGAPRSGLRRDRSAIMALIVASVLLTASVVMAFGGVFGPVPWQSTTATQGPLGGGGHGGMMAGQVWLVGNGEPITTIAQARTRAAEAGAPKGLHPGEVIQFTENFYVELKDSAGAAATEVLVSPVSGAVQTEPGPAMMWNTGSGTSAITQEQAQTAAAAWLAPNRPGETVRTVDAYPGYYTADTQVDGKPAGMLSVNATTGAVWYHTWHGTFVAMEDG